MVIDAGVVIDGTGSNQSLLYTRWWVGGNDGDDDDDADDDGDVDGGIDGGGIEYLFLSL